MDVLHTWDLALLKTINGWHGAGGDFLMWWASDRYIWIPLYLLLVWLLYRSYGLRGLVVLLPCIALLILATDQLAWQVKEHVMRLRPSHNDALSGWLHLVRNYRGGTYGFFSAHAANTMALALWCGIMLRQQHKKLWMLLIGWSLLTGYSRIYLGVHYPSDVAAGFAAGLLTGMAFNILAKWGLRHFVPERA